MRRTAAPSQLFNANNKIPKLDIMKNDASIIESRYPLPEPKSIIQSHCDFSYYSVAYGKPSKKKHKTWDGDGFISVSESNIKLITTEGKEIGSCIKKQLSKVILEEGATFTMGGKFVEILSAVSQPVFETNNVSVSTPIADPLRLRFPNKQFQPVLITGNESQNNEGYPVIKMPRPSASHIFRYNQSCAPLRDVIMDPQLASRMRPHQIDGTIFLYECVLGLRAHGGTGAILADSMGLGKTVQTIALIWTLLNQGPYDSGPFIRRCLIVCPSSLVLNWKMEFEKWIGNNRIKPFCVTGDTRVENFLGSSSNSVLILSYEMLIRNLETVQSFSFDLIVCDEAHRLKNTNIKTSMGVESLRIPRRILLTGTPLQNDMDEFFAIVEFCNPGVLGCSKEVFRKRFVQPMTAAREPSASQDVIDLGYDASLRLQRLTQLFILRRTEIVNTRYLPPKDEYIIFCSPTQMQLKLYNILLESQMMQNQLNSGSSLWSGVDALSCITLLRKLCNDPILFIRHVIDKENANKLSGDDQESTLLNEIHKNLEYMSRGNETLRRLVHGNLDVSCDQIFSGKLWVTAQMLVALAPAEKLVLASHFTQTLDLLQKLCSNLGLKYQRIDGQTLPAARMNIVNDFNKTGKGILQQEILLLSCKAGGEGLNLTGASKIILYDLDWNPATDAQAMARVWRDGQANRVSTYMLVTTGTVEESLLQRQIAKQQLSTSIVDVAGLSSKQTTFSQHELKNIFTLHSDSTEAFGCWTHQLLNCDCQSAIDSAAVVIQRLADSPSSAVNANCQLGLGQQVGNKVNLPNSIAQLNSWTHWIGAEDISNKSTDHLVLSAVNQISCVFMRTINACDSDNK